MTCPASLAAQLPKICAFWSAQLWGWHSGTAARQADRSRHGDREGLRALADPCYEYARGSGVAARGVLPMLAPVHHKREFPCHRHGGAADFALDDRRAWRGDRCSPLDLTGIGAWSARARRRPTETFGNYPGVRQQW